MLGAIMYVLLWIPVQLCQSIFWRWQVEGLEHLPPAGTGMVLVVNHLSWFDIPIIGASLPLKYRLWWVAKTEVFENPIVAWWMRTMHVIPVRRDRRDLSALTAAENALKQGAPLVIFPEGHRSDTAELQEGHGGAIRLAVRTGCPIVPIAIWGTEAGLRGAILRKPLHLRVGEPYYISLPGKKIPWNRMNELTDEMMLRIAELLPEEYRGFYRERMLEVG